MRMVKQIFGKDGVSENQCWKNISDKKKGRIQILP